MEKVAREEEEEEEEEEEDRLVHPSSRVYAKNTWIASQP